MRIKQTNKQRTYPTKVIEKAVGWEGDLSRGGFHLPTLSTNGWLTTREEEKDGHHELVFFPLMILPTIKKAKRIGAHMV